MSSASSWVQNPNSFSRRFGKEITNSIIDFLSADKQALASSALVCRDWVKRSQFHLLRSVSVRGKERYAAFVDALPSLGEHARSSIQGFTVSSSPHAPLEVLVARCYLIYIMDYLPNLRNLTLQEVRLDYAREDIGPDYVPRSIDRLSFIDVVGFPDQYSVLSATIASLRLFHSVRVLHVRRNKSQDIAFWGELPREAIDLAIIRRYETMPMYLRIEELHYYGAPREIGVLYFLRYTGTVQSLRRLYVRCVDQITLMFVQDLLVDNPAVLEVLSLDLMYHMQSVVEYGFPKWILDSSKFTSLRTLSVHSIVRTWAMAATTESCYSMLALLDYLAPTPVVKIELILSIQWELKGGETSAFSFLLQEEPERKSWNYAGKMIWAVDWSRLEVLQSYPCLKNLYIEMQKEDVDDDDPNAYLLPLLQNLPGKPGEKMELELRWLFWDINGKPRKI